MKKNRTLILVVIMILAAGCTSIPNTTGNMPTQMPFVTPVTAIRIRFELPSNWKATYDFISPEEEAKSTANSPRYIIKAQSDIGEELFLSVKHGPPSAGSTASDILEAFTRMVEAGNEEMERKTAISFTELKMKCVGFTKYAVFEYSKEGHLVEFAIAKDNYIYELSFYGDGNWKEVMSGLFDIVYSAKLISPEEGPLPTKSGYFIHDKVAKSEVVVDDTIVSDHNNCQ